MNYIVNILHLVFKMIKKILLQLYKFLIQVCKGKKMNNYQDFYVYKATLNVHDLCYVEREADQQLYEGLKDNDHITICYVFNSRKMGKSSLETRVRTRLKQEDNYICAEVNFNLKSSDKNSVTVDQWYFSIVKTIAKELNLNIYNEDDTNVLNQWWNNRKNQTYLDTLTDLLEKSLKDFPQNNILIVFDEIDTLKRLEFSTDDLFAFIRGCHNTRQDHPDSEYKRLHFCIVGTATPSDLISDEFRTPFNVGKAIELRGFTLEEAISGLSEGLRDKVDNPEEVLKNILYWTNGQPFLTQKLCALAIEQGDRNPNIQELVRTKIINNWDDPIVDNPEYLRTIRDRIIFKDEYIERRLILYQKIWKSEENKEAIKPNQSKEQEQLCLSGLVINTGGQLKISNLICRTIFDLKWIEEELNKLLPSSLQEYAQQWEYSQDQSFLLTGQTLQDALQWKERMAGEDFIKNYPLYSKFLEASDNFNREAVFTQKNRINNTQQHNWVTIRSKLLGKINATGTQYIEIAEEISLWTNDSELILDQMICKSLSSESDIPEGTEREWVQQWIKTNIINNWKNTPLVEQITIIQNCLLEGESYFGRLDIYQKILQQSIDRPINYSDNDKFDENDINALLAAEIIKKDDNGDLLVANRIYEAIFSLDWVKEHLPPYATSYGRWEKEKVFPSKEELFKIINWQKEKNFNFDPLVLDFIIRSLVYNTWQEIPENVIEIIKKSESQLKNKTKTPYTLIYEILVWIGTIPNIDLLEEILEFISDTNPSYRKLYNILTKQKIAVDERHKFRDVMKKQAELFPLWVVEQCLKIMDNQTISELNKVLHEIFTEADRHRQLKCIVIFDGEEITLFRNPLLTEDESNLYEALFNSDYTDHIKILQDLGKTKNVLNVIGQQLNFGSLKFSLFRLEKLEKENIKQGNIVAYFLQREIPLAIYFMATTEDSFRSLQILCETNMPKIEQALIKNLVI